MTTEQQDAFRKMVAAGTGIPAERVIPADEGGPRPVEPFASVLLIDDQPVMSTSAQKDGEGAEILRQNKMAWFSVQVAGDDDALGDFVLWVDSADCRLAETEAGLRIQRPIKAAKRDVVHRAGWTPRVVLTIPVEYAQETRRTVETVGNVDPIDFALESRSGRFSVTATVRVS